MYLLKSYSTTQMTNGHLKLLKAERTTGIKMTKNTTGNSTFAIGGVSCPTDSFVVANSFALPTRFSGKNPARRKSADRYRSCLEASEFATDYEQSTKTKLS